MQSWLLLASCKTLLFSFAFHSVINCADVAIMVTEITPAKDQSGYEAYRKLRFVLMDHVNDLGVVVVHLYHSSRTVQIQGSALMPNNTKVAVWFAKMTVQRFRDEANNKQFHIKELNDAVLQHRVHPVSHLSSTNFFGKI